MKITPHAPLPWSVSNDYMLTGRHLPVIVDANDNTVFAAHIAGGQETLELIVEAVNTKYENGKL